ncbi:MAG: hypothetical protein C0403_19990, partial [Desulfobacterium sp.]|nr:hypothetical protein [Desulfobacterium sp.]
EQTDVTVIGGIAPSEAKPVRVDMNPFTTTLSPVDDDNTANIDTPRFQWEAIANASSYQVQVSTVADFSSIQMDEESAASNFTTPAFSSSGAYYWRVRPIDMHGSEGAWSSVQPLNIMLLPTLSTNDANSVTRNSADISGTVNPKGLATTCHFEYGTTTSYGLVTPDQNIGQGIADVSVNAVITGLNPETTYHYRLVATNSAGATYGPDQTLTTINVPSAITEAAGSIDSSSATLNGTVNPKGANTDYYFEYGTTTSYGSTTPKQDAGSGRTDLSVKASITGLIPQTDYHYRLVAINSEGRINGSDRTFTSIDSTPPTITKMAPTNNAFNVGVHNRKITATFSEPMNGLTITTGTFLVHDGTGYITGGVAYVGATATFTPSLDLKYDTAYTVTIASGVKDMAGIPMAADYSWSFSTAEQFRK